MKLPIYALFLVSMSSYAEPIVLHDSGETHAIAPYMEDLEIGAAPEVKVEQTPPRTPSMSVGKVKTRKIKTPMLPMPIFLIGTDSVSLKWLQTNKAVLMKMNAVGMIINSKSHNDTAKTLKLGDGLQMTAVSAQGLSRQFQMKHYPVLITKNKISQ